MPERILILGGTGEARRLADGLVERGYDVVTSLAGVTRQPALPKGKVRHGGFGGVEGLTEFLSGERFSLIIDATHPFAAQMSAHAFAAALRCSVPLTRLERPAWEKPRDGEWQSVANFAEAFDAISAGGTVFVTTGRKNLHTLAEYPSLGGVVRSIEAPNAPLAAGWSLILDRPPFDIDHELGLMRQNHITHLICKNSGGTQMITKVKAANTLAIAVLVIERPVKPPCLTYSSIPALLEAVGSLHLPR